MTMSSAVGQPTIPERLPKDSSVVRRLQFVSNKSSKKKILKKLKTGKILWERS